jgi:thiosulfate/3-mercaptopyruvate sulfurtransferase
MRQLLMGSDVLISTQDLAELLRSDRPPLLADVRWNLGGPSGKPEFEGSHIAGAVWVDLETQLASPPGVGGRHPLPTPAAFGQAMRDIGVRQDSLVVAYDAANSQAAARLWWLLTDAGHRAVKVLNGGFAAWKAAGMPTVSGPSAPAAAGDFIAHSGQRPQHAAAEIRARLGSLDAPILIDVRTPERYAGEKEPIDPVAGHIPGAINLPWDSNVCADGRFRPADEIARRFAEVGGKQDAVLCCGSGITATHSLLALESAGLCGTALYPGSWSEWISEPSRPIATGTNP